jgi:hypothetical protein
MGGSQAWGADGRLSLDPSVVVALLTREERRTSALDWSVPRRGPLISGDWLISKTHSSPLAGDALASAVVVTSPQYH